MNKHMIIATRTAKKIIAVTLVAIVALIYSFDVNASEYNAMDGFVGGIFTILDATGEESEESIKTIASQLNISLEVEEVEEEEENTSDIVMANVWQSLNVREEPTTDSERVGLLYRDCGGTILERGEEWTKLQSGNIVGWCSNEYLLFDEEAEELAASVGITLAQVNVETLRVRDEESEDSNLIYLMPRGEIVEVIGSTNGEWIKIDCEGNDGYVLADYVDITFVIDAGETNEEIEIREEAEREAKRHVNYGQYTTDADTTLLLAALIQCEAGGESYEGQLAVGAVVMNRVRSAAYPNTIHGVIYASGQFTPALSGRLDTVYFSGNIKQSCINAANEALEGVSNVADYTHFRRNDGRDGIVIGNHVFY